MPARVKKARNDSDDDDGNYGSDADTVMNESPRVAVKSSKKKVTQFLVPIGNDEKFSDQRREKRRSSFKVVQAGEGDDDIPTSSGAAAPRMPHRRLSQLNVVAQTPALPQSLEIMSSNYEEWMKMATDNKINAANSWNFALIDYFADMSLLRNDTDKSINFQKASCTLDGCVKIWTSRVDSVGTATGQLLNNLANDGHDDDGDEEDEGEEGANGEGGKKRRAHRPESTLAKPQQLRSKKPDLDLDFTVDPLFKKTRADFDEGGAGGLLMNHLSVDGNLRVIFDSSDSNQHEEGEKEEPIDLLDLSELRREFFPTLNSVEDLAVSHSLEGFSFDKGYAQAYDATLSFHDDVPDMDDDDGGLGDATFRVADDDGAAMDVDAGGDTAPGTEDFFSGDQAVPDYDEFIPPPQDNSFADGDQENTCEGPSEGAGASTFQSFDPRSMPNEREFMVAMADNEQSMVDYFDPSFLKNWAGPEHWKVRRNFRRPDQSMVDKSVPGAANKTRKEKKVFRIDFSEPSDIDTKSLFAGVSRGTGLTLPSLARPTATSTAHRTSDATPRDDYTLPEDMHFSANTLVSLFLKPKFTLMSKLHGRNVRPVNGDEVDDQFWARAAAEQAAARADDDGDETGALPFATQFFNDDLDDAPGFDDAYDGEGPGPDATVGAPEEDHLAASQGESRRIRPQAINYSKRAKRVDVRKLKENIWKSLGIVVDKVLDEEDEDERPPKPLTDPKEAKPFATVVDGLKHEYSKDKMDEISSSFCFICLLHLANEEGLKIAKPDEPNNEDNLFAPVGNIRSLQVFRDPTATRAA
ncbi:barren [Auriculariales sp. MPI-PUGE-AT-0066]|nr:barren [Auriculariales sp. MPI-PUGE-AT-0066]